MPLRMMLLPRTAPGIRATCEAFRLLKFWIAYEARSLRVGKLADTNDALLKRDPRHPSLQFKKVRRYWCRDGVNRCEARSEQLDDRMNTTRKRHRHATRKGVPTSRSQRPLNLESRCSWYRLCRRSTSACLRPKAAAGRCCRSGVDKLRLASQKGRWMLTRKCRFS
jgi:hypothetical protein